MQLGPKYKIARRLGAPIFEKTQNAKFAASKEKRSTGFSKPKTAFGTQMNEKQKARFTYGISEKQFKNYVNEAISLQSGSQTEALFEKLETRLDNVVARSAFANTRRGARQAVSHGHITVNGRKVTIPSYRVSIGDKIAVREGSKAKGVFRTLEEVAKTAEVPNWLKVDAKNYTIEVTGKPKLNPTELLFDLQTIFEYYRR